MNRLTRAVRSLFATAPAAKRPARLALENLETRWCPAVAISTSNGGHTLVITGDNNANAVTVTQDDDDNEIKVVVAGGQTRFFDSDDITDVKVDLKRGNDTFTYKLGGGSDFERAKNIFVQLGRGADKATFDFAAGSAEIQANLGIAVAEDGSDRDRVDVTLGEVQGVDVFVQTKLGFADDTVNVTLKGDLKTNADVKLNLIDNNNFQILFVVPLQLGGDDKYTVKADSDVDIADGATLDVAVAAGDGRDLIDLRYDGELDGKLKAVLNGNDGADTVKAVLDIDDGSEGTIDVKVIGGKGNDTLRLQVFVDDDADPTIVTALADGGAGSDAATVTSNVTKVGI